MIEEYLHLFETKSAHDAVYNGANYKEPWVGYIEATDDVTFNKPTQPHDYSLDYFTTTALEDGTITFNKDVANLGGTNVYLSSSQFTRISYSTDNGSTWTTMTNNGIYEAQSLSVNVIGGQKIIWKALATQFGKSGGSGVKNCGKFTSTCNFNASGNIMSLLYEDNFVDQISLPSGSHTFYGLFRGNQNLISAENLRIPATGLTNNCYSYMFYDCSSMTSIQESLPAETLTSMCYGWMFYGCSSLCAAPALPATSLTNSCYACMFTNCTSLTTAPDLMATTLVSSCYAQMFDGCTSLNYIKAMFTTTPSTSNTSVWVRNVSSIGTFVKNSAATWTTTGDNGVPEGWTIETASA